MAPTRLRIAQNWVTLTKHSGHSLQPLTIISFFPPTSVPSQRGEAVMGMFLGECERKLVLMDSCTHTHAHTHTQRLAGSFKPSCPSCPSLHSQTPQTPAQTKVTLVPLTGEDRGYLGGQSLGLPLPLGSLAFCILRV